MADTTLVHRYSLPRCLVRGVDNTDVSTYIYNADGTGATFTAVDSYTLYQGSRVLHTTSSISVGLGTGLLALQFGIPAADLPVTEPLSDTLMEHWTVTINGQVQTFTRPVYLVRQLLNPTITDTDLTAVHSDLLDHIDPDQTTFERQRSDAWIELNHWLINKGNRPQLILDDWKLRSVHRSLTLYNICKDFASSVGDGRWHELAYGDKARGIVGYLERAEREFAALSFRYDFDEDGTPDQDETKPAEGPILLQKPWGWNSRSRGR